MAANGTFKSPLSVPIEKGPPGQSASPMPLAHSHLDDRRITTNLNTHSGDEILKYMQSNINCNTGRPNDEAKDSQVSSSISSIQKAIAEMLTNIRASTNPSNEPKDKFVSSEVRTKRTEEDLTSEQSNVKATGKHPDKANKIKRPMNAFMVWAREYRQVLSKGFPKENNSQISVRLGDIWSNLTSEEKQPFYDKADLLRRQHERDYPDWVYQPNKRKRTSASFPQAENKVVMATSAQVRGVLNNSNLGQNFQVQIRPSIKTVQPLQAAKDLQENSSQVSRQMSELSQTPLQQVKGINITQSQRNGPIHVAGPQFLSPKRPATTPVNESPLAADKFQSLLSRYPMTSVLGQLSPEPPKKKSKPTIKQSKRKQPQKAKAPQQTKSKKKGKKPSPEKTPMKKVANNKTSVPEPTNKAQQPWNSSGVPIGGVQTLLYSPYPTTVANMQIQNHAVPLIHQGQPIVQVPAPSQFITTTPTGFVNMQRLPQQSTQSVFYHGNAMGPVPMVHRFPDPMTIRPDYSQPPPQLALPVQSGVMYPARPFLPIMQDFKPVPHFPSQVVTFGPALNVSNNQNNNGVYCNNNTNNNNIIYTNTNINGSNTSGFNDAQKVVSNTAYTTTNATSINMYNSTIINDEANPTINKCNINSSNNSCDKKMQKTDNNNASSTTNFSNNTNTGNSTTEGSNDGNVPYVYTNNDNNRNCKEGFAEKTFSNSVNSKINTNSTTTNNISCSNAMTSRINNVSSRNNVQYVFSKTLDGKPNFCNTTNNSNCSNSSNCNERSYSSNGISHARDIFRNTVNSTTLVGNNSPSNNSSINNNNIVNNPTNARSYANNNDGPKMNISKTPSYTNNNEAIIIDIPNKITRNKDNTNSVIHFMPQQSRNILEVSNNEIATNTDDKTIPFNTQTGVTAKRSEVHSATIRPGETYDQSDNWILQPPTNPATNPPMVRSGWNLNPQEETKVQQHRPSYEEETPTASEFSKSAGSNECLAPLPPKKSFLQTLNTPISNAEIVNQLNTLIRPPSLPYGATKKVTAPPASDDSSRNMCIPPIAVQTDNSNDSTSSNIIREPCSAGPSAKRPVQSSFGPSSLTQTSDLPQYENFQEGMRDIVSNNDDHFLATIDHGNSVFNLTDCQSIVREIKDRDTCPPETNSTSVPSSTSVAVLNSPTVAVCQQGGIIYINDSFSPASLKKDGVPHHLLQSSYSSSSSDSSFQLPDHMKPIDLSIVSIESNNLNNSIPQGCEKFLLDMDSKEILVNTQGWDMTRCEEAKQGPGLGDKKMLVQLRRAHDDFLGT